VIPIRDENPTTRTPYVTLAIIALNLLAFLLWEPTFSNSEARQEAFFFCHSEIPYEVIHHTSLAEGGPDARAAIDHADLGVSGRALQRFLLERCPHKNWLFSVFTAMFLHAGWLHIGGNLLFLWVFGNNVEDKLRPLRFFLFYIASGIVAAVVQTAIVHSGTDAVLPNLGASGAIAGVLGAYLLMFPRRRVLTVILFFIITAIYVPAFVVLGAWFVLQFFNGVLALSKNVNVGGGVAVWAHIGGFAFGALMALLFFPKERFGARPPPPRPDFLGRRRGWGRRAAPPPPPPPPAGWP
jgi:membrane associated rhomboid family serine protease